MTPYTYFSLGQMNEKAGVGSIKYNPLVLLPAAEPAAALDVLGTEAPYNLDPAMDISGAAGRAAKKSSSLFFCEDFFFSLDLFLLRLGRPAPVRVPPWPPALIASCRVARFFMYHATKLKSAIARSTI